MVPAEETLTVSGVLSEPRQMERKSFSPWRPLPAFLPWVPHSTGEAVPMASEVPAGTGKNGTTLLRLSGNGHQALS